MSLTSFLVKNSIIDNGQLMLKINDALPDELCGYYFIVKEIKLMTDDKLFVAVTDEYEIEPVNCEITFDINENNELIYKNHINL